MGKQTERPWLIVFVSDLHAGSITGLCPADGIKLEGDDVYIPGPAGQRTWANWVDLWKRAKERKKETNARLVLCLVGDLTDGKVFRDQNLISLSTSLQVEIALQSLRPALDLKPEKIYVSRGTPVHVGPLGELETAVARAIGAEKHPDTKQQTGYKWHLQCHGKRILATHHPPSSGRLVRTRKSQASLAANEVACRYWERGLPCPDFAIFAHAHEPVDTGPEMHRKTTRAIVLGPWQRKTQYAERYAGLSFGEHHALFLTIWPDNRESRVEHVVYTQADSENLWREIK